MGTSTTKRSVLAALLTVSLATGCSGDGDEPDQAKDSSTAPSESVDAQTFLDDAVAAVNANKVKAFKYSSEPDPAFTAIHVSGTAYADERSWEARVSSNSLSYEVHSVGDRRWVQGRGTEHWRDDCWIQVDEKATVLRVPAMTPGEPVFMEVIRHFDDAAYIDEDAAETGSGRLTAQLPMEYAAWLVSTPLDLPPFVLKAGTEGQVPVTIMVQDGVLDSVDIDGADVVAAWPGRDGSRVNKAIAKDLTSRHLELSFPTGLKPLPATAPGNALPPGSAPEDCAS